MLDMTRVLGEHIKVISGARVRFYSLECACGKLFDRRVSCYNRPRKNFRSCGCMKAHITSITKKKHGLRQSSEYRSWTQIKERCYNKNSKKYPLYGGRGIVVCSEWLDSFSNFIKDMGKKPDPSFSLDRINNNGNYTAENCRWASKQQQAANRRTSRIVIFNNKEMCLADFCRFAGIDIRKTRSKVNSGKSISEATGGLACEKEKNNA